MSTNDDIYLIIMTKWYNKKFFFVTILFLENFNNIFNQSYIYKKSFSL